MANRIALIGVELEGCWHVKPEGAHGDSSVQVNCRTAKCSYQPTTTSGVPLRCNCVCDDCDDGNHCCDRDEDCRAGLTSGGNIQMPYTGELSGTPMTIDALDDYIERFYPDHVDKSCGQHVHMSFIDEADYSRLMYEDFWEFFQKSWEEWAPLHLHKKSSFWDRFSGNNQYCLRKFTPETQWADRGRNGSRYAQLNFCYGLHKTLECRLLPMFQSKQTSKKAIWHLISLVNTFLNTCDKPVIRSVEVIDTDAEADIEEILETVDMAQGIPRLSWDDPNIPYVYDRLSRDEHEIIEIGSISTNIGHPLMFEV